MENQYLKNIKVGMKVLILLNNKKESTGIIEEIATRNEFSEEGIMVRLKNGDVGRVKKIILTEPEKNEKKAEELKNRIKEGEDFHTEFKTSAFWSSTFNPIQIKESNSLEVREYGNKASKVIIAKAIAAFLNSDGGSLIIGVNENKNNEKFDIVGINEDIKRVNQTGTDSYKRVIIDEILKKFFPSKIFNHLDTYISFEFVKIEEKLLCNIKIKKSDSRVFLNIQDKEIFMIRINSENRTLQGEKLVDYCIKNWSVK